MFRDAQGNVLPTGLLSTLGGLATDAIHWSSSDATVATVGTAAGSAITGVAPDVVTITGSYLNSANVSIQGSATVTVGPTTNVITVIPSTPLITVGGTLVLRTTVRDAAGNQLTGDVTWLSRNSSLATATLADAFGNGLLTGVSTGTPTSTPFATVDIVARAAGAQTTLTATVYRAVSQVIVTPATTTLQPNQTATLGARLVDNLGNTIPNGATILTWTSTDKNAATVSQSGLVTAVAGRADPLQIQVTTTEGVVGTASITVPLAGSYTLTPVTSPITVSAGSTASALININRTNFTGAVTVTGAGQTSTGITATSAPTTGNQAALAITIPTGLAPGSYPVTLSGSSSLATVAGSITVTIPLVLSNTNWTFCPVSGVPLFVAVQDGTAPWSAITGNAGTYLFSIASARGGIAYVTQNSGITTTHVFYGSQTELAAQGLALCGSSTGAVGSASGVVINAGTATTVDIGLGTATAFAHPPATTTFTLNAVPPGPLDLVAAALDGATLPNPIRMLLRRNFTGSSAGALDFAGAESFVPVLGSTLTIGSGLSQTVALTYFLHSSNAALAAYYNAGTTGIAAPLFGLPAAQQQAGDLHYASAQAFGAGGGTSTRTAGVLFASVASKSLSFGSVGSTPTVTSVAGIAVQRMAIPTQGEYSKLWQADYDQSSNLGRTATVQMTVGYLGTAATANLDLPDLSAVPGWASSYGLVIGSSANWKATVAGWSTPAGITFVQFIDGATYTAATTTGSSTP